MDRGGSLRCIVGIHIDLQGFMGFAWIADSVIL